MNKIVYSGNNLPSETWQDTDKLLRIAQTPVSKLRPYTAQITRNTPTAFVFMLDQSGSMNGKITINGTTRTKALFLADFMNKMLNEVLNKCKRDEYRDYVDICVIGYGGDDDNTAKIAWEGSLADKTFVSINALRKGYLEEKEEKVRRPRPDGSYREIARKVYSWIRPKAKRLTPMHEAFHLTRDLLVEWLNRHEGQDIYPPTVFNISDGMASNTTYDDLLDITGKIKDLSTMDGHTLLFNIHLSDADDSPVVFPSKPHELPNDKFARLMFDMSSDLPDNYNNDIVNLTQKDLDGAFTGLAYNSDMAKLISLLNIGTNTPLKNIR